MKFTDSTNNVNVIKIKNITNATYNLNDNNDYVITPIDSYSDVIIDFGEIVVETLGDAAFSFKGEIVSYEY